MTWDNNNYLPNSIKLIELMRSFYIQNIANEQSLNVIQCVILFMMTKRVKLN